MSGLCLTVTVLAHGLKGMEGKTGIPQSPLRCGPSGIRVLPRSHLFTVLIGYHPGKQAFDYLEFFPQIIYCYFVFIGILPASMSV